MKFLFFCSLLALCFSSCKEELRIDLLSENGKEVQFDLEKEDVVNLYAEIDIEYKVKPLFVYHCSFKKESVLMFEGGTDPLESKEKTKESLIVKNGITHWKFYGKLDGNLVAKEDGKYLITTSFLKNKAADLKINKADIVFVR